MPRMAPVSTGAAGALVDEAGVAAAILVLSVAVAQPESKAPERARVAKSPRWVGFTAVHPLQARGYAESETRASGNGSKPFQQIPCRLCLAGKILSLAYPLLLQSRTTVKPSSNEGETVKSNDFVGIPTQGG